MLPVRGEPPATRPPKVPLLLMGCAPQKNAFPRSKAAGTKGRGRPDVPNPTGTVQILAQRCSLASSQITGAGSAPAAPTHGSHQHPELQLKQLLGASRTHHLGYREVRKQITIRQPPAIKTPHKPEVLMVNASPHPPAQIPLRWAS